MGKSIGFWVEDDEEIKKALVKLKEKKQQCHKEKKHRRKAKSDSP